MAHEVEGLVRVIEHDRGRLFWRVGGWVWLLFGLGSCRV